MNFSHCTLHKEYGMDYINDDEEMYMEHEKLVAGPGRIDENEKAEIEVPIHNQDYCILLT